ncbi:MAG: DUF3488 and DUF4129 domain-containing transglutaminase family protein [Bryobacteraceae bacterium]
MARPSPSAAVSVERFFQFSLLGLVASGYLAVAGSGYLDTPTVLLAGSGLLLRGLLICGLVKLNISERATSLIALAYAGFYALDYFLLSRDFLTATVHLVFFLAVLKIFTARTGRDYLYTAAIAFLELVAAAILSVNFNFFLILALYLLFAIAALTSGEIRRSMHKAASPARSGPRRFHARLAALAVSVTLGILMLTGGLFFLLPRTAEAAFERLVPHRVHVPGFSSLVNLGETGEFRTSSRPVMHIQIFNREPVRGLKWRGGALTAFDGKRWTNPPDKGGAILIPIEDGHVILGSASPGQRGINYHVEMEPLDTDALFLAGTPLRVDLHRPFLFRTAADTFHMAHGAMQGIRYDAYSALEEPPENTPAAWSVPELTPAERDRELQLPSLDPRIPQLARSIAAGAVSSLDRARAIERALRTRYGYTMRLPDREVADPLAWFLFTRKQGHCEYFASAMTVLLRTLGIPSRMATGFESGVYNSITDLWLIRASDAHTWVEAWIPGYGWKTFDPTPPDPNPTRFSLATQLSLYLDAAETFWQDWVVSYDLGRQDALVDSMERGARHTGIRWFDSFSGLGSGWGGRMMAWIRAFGLRAAIVLALGLWAWFLAPPLVRLLRIGRRVRKVRRGQVSLGDATLLYQRMLHVLKRHGYQKPPWFTPAEFAGSLPEGDLAAAVAEFTRAYNALRFGGRTEAAPRLSLLLDNLQRQAVTRR